ncbi:Transposase [Carboxydocella thermautotrophica]|nr:Transposase [Carboxydocella thermautotrophica]
MRQYTEEFKEQILAECREVGNVALVARRHQISENTIYTWIKKKRKNGSLKPLPKS